MIITCAECSTNFNLDEKLLKKEGSKVSCCVCDYVFTVFPPLEPSDNTENQPLTAVKQPLDAFSESDAPNLDLNAFEESLIALDEPELEIEEINFDTDEASSEPEFQELTIQDSVDQESEPALEQTEQFVESDGFSLELGIDEVEEEGFFELDQETIDQNIEPVSELTLAQDTQEDFGIEELSEEHIEIEEINFIPEQTPRIELDDTDSEEKMPPPIPHQKKKEALQEHRPMDLKPATSQNKRLNLTISKPVTGFVVLAILLGAAYMASMMTGFKIPVIQPAIERLFKSAPLPASSIAVVPDEASIKGQFVTNATAGTLFVITGNIINDSTVTASHILVKATLSTKGNVITRSKEVYGANAIQETLLTTGSIEAIDRVLMKKQTQNITRLKPGQQIPFTAVFSNLPENLEGFSVEVKTYDQSDT